MALAHLSLCLFTLAAFELHGVQSWPSWLPVPAPFVRTPVINDKEFVNDKEFAGPQGLLLRQLKGVDIRREPQKALTLHVAIARMLRAEGTHNDNAIQHLEAARDAALRSADADSILSTRLELAQAYIEAGRPKDADHELESKPETNSLLSPENFWEYSIKLDIARGRASFELGEDKIDTQSALETFEMAARIANQPEDIVQLACNMAMAHACLGHSQRSLEPLRNALEVLAKAREAETITVATHMSLAMEVHTRFAEAFHSMGDIASAKASYKEASSLEVKLKTTKVQGTSAIETNMKNLEKGDGPSLRCPGGAHTQRFQIPARSDGGKAFKAKIASLLEVRDYGKAERELWNHLETQKRPYKSLEATTTLISLGNLYLLAEKKSYFKAAQCFLKALPASLSCCGARSKEAKAAFEGLSYVQDMIPAKERSRSAKVMQEYFDAVESSASPNDLGQSISVLQLV